MRTQSANFFHLKNATLAPRAVFVSAIYLLIAIKTDLFDCWTAINEITHIPSPTQNSRKFHFAPFNVQMFSKNLFQFLTLNIFV
jgi:hypothetical protein